MYGLLNLCVYLLQDRLLYHPQPEIVSPAEHSRSLTSGDAFSIRYTVVNPGMAPALIFFGGNAENVGYIAEDFAVQFPNHSTYLLHYRGYGGSEGSPNEKALVADAAQLHQLVSAQHREVHLIGRSLGSGIAMQIAAKFPGPHSKLLLITPYDSIAAVAERKFWFLPVGLLLRDRYDSCRYAAQVKHRVLILIAGADHIIPRANSLNLQSSNCLSGKAMLQTIADSDHGDITFHEAFWQAARGLLEPNVALENALID